MTDIEVSEMLKKLIVKYQTVGEEFKKSADFLNDRLDEIEKQNPGELSNELQKEVIEIERKKKELEEQFITNILTGIDQNQMLDILSKINPDFIEKNHFHSLSFKNIIGFILKRIDDPNHEIHNKLLSNGHFIDAINDCNNCLTELITNANDERIVLNFLLNYVKTSKKVDETNSLFFLENEDIAFFMTEIVNSTNYSLEFKNSILSNQILLSYIPGNKLGEIIEESSLPDNNKLELLFKPSILNKLSDLSFSSVLGSLCKSYDDCYKVLTNQILPKQINVGFFLATASLSDDDIKKILFNDEFSQLINGETLGYLLHKRKMDFEIKKQILFDEKLFFKLDASAIRNVITCKYLTSQQRFELLNDDRILTMIDNSFDSEWENSNIINQILLSLDVPIADKVLIIQNQRFKKYVQSQALQKIMSNSDIPIETATEILFDKELFYKLINEWNEEYNHPDSFYDDKGPYRYDKYEYVQKLYKRNPFIARTLSYELLRDDILDLGFDFIEKMSKYKTESMNLVRAFSSFGYPEYLVNMIKTIENSCYASSIDIALFVTKIIAITNGFYSYHGKTRKLFKIIHTANFDTSIFTADNWRTITEIGLRDISSYYNGLSNGLQDNVEIDISLNILPDVNSMDDLNYYEVRRRTLCDEYFEKAKQERNLDGIKNAYLNKYFSVNIQEAQEIVRMYGHSLQYFSEKPEYFMQTKYIQQLQKIINIQKIATMSEIYNNSQIEPITFDEMIFIDQSIRQMFSKQMSDSMYKVSDKVLDDNDEYVANVPRIMEFVVETNGVKTIKKVPVYEPGYDFKMMIHSTAAYGQLELINDNYFDSWNKSSRVTNHGICCSMISNDNLGMARVNDVLFGFDSWDPKAITKSAPYDIYSENDSYNIQEGRSLIFMSAQDIIDNTRHSHNEHVLERYELRAEKRTNECQNIQPSYVIIYSDMTDEIKQKAIKCSMEMNIPIVYLDKEKIVQHEVGKIDKKIAAFVNCTDFEEKLNILEQILLSHENNRSGLRITNPEWLEQYFPTSKIENLFESVIVEIQTGFQKNENIVDYFKYSSRLMDILEKEEKKFKVTMETTERKNYIDVPVYAYKARLMTFVNPNLCRMDRPKLETIIQTSQTETPDLALNHIFSSININLLHIQVEDILKKNLYPNNEKNHNIGHIERVLFLSQLIGRQELKLENGDVDEHALSLLLECAKYHDCGRESDSADKSHGKKSANRMMSFLQQDGFSDDDIKIMQIAVEYHEEVDDDFIFEQICEKYGITSEQTNYAKKIANCLKDADALDRTRFANPNAKLDADMLRYESSKDLISVAETLNRSYEKFDRQQFIKTCQSLYQQSLSQVQIDQSMYAEQSELINQGRKK